MTKNSKNKKISPKKIKKSAKAKSGGAFAIPKQLLAPVARFLRGNLKKLERTKSVIATEDPFADSGRLNDNASPDTDAAEQFGHARTLAIKEQIDRKIIQTRKALARVKIGKYGVCEVCGEMIDTDRLVIYPETTLCTKHAGRAK